MIAGMTVAEWLVVIGILIVPVGNVAIWGCRKVGRNDWGDWLTAKLPGIAAYLARNPEKIEAAAKTIVTIRSLPELGHAAVKLAGMQLESAMPESVKAPSVASGAGVILPCLLFFVLISPVTACAPLTPAQQDQAGKVIEAGAEAGIELADHICTSTGRHKGFVDFACVFIGALNDNGKDGPVTLEPARPPIVVHVPEAQAAEFERAHSPDTLVRQGGE